MNLAKLVQQGCGLGKKARKGRKKKKPRPKDSLSVYTMGPMDFLFPSWPMFLFAPHGIWYLIKESRIGCNGGTEPGYEMLLGD